MKSKRYLWFYTKSTLQLLLISAATIAILTIGCSDERSTDTAGGLAPTNDSLWIDRTSDFLDLTAEWTNRVEVADINNDGWPDLLFANGGNYSQPGEPEYSRIFINRGADQKFREITRDVFDQPMLARVIKVADLNSDGFQDIFVGTTYQSRSRLYLGTSDGVFQDVTDSALPQIEASVGDIEFGDVDLDGDLDIALVDWGPGSNMQNEGGVTMLWLNDGKGKFADVTGSRMPDLRIQFSWDLEFIDFDNDFDLDLAISCKRCGTGRMYMNDSTGHFKDVRVLPAYTNNYDYEVMDLNADGFMDMVTINDGEIVGGVGYSRREHILFNDGGEYFIDATDTVWATEHNVGEDDNNIAFLDYDSDGDADFLIGSLTGEDRLIENFGGKQFKLHQPVIAGAFTGHTLLIQLADLNLDGKLDIAMAQGEGDENIEERIFLGHHLAMDTSPPVIGKPEISTNANGEPVISARVHNLKSPNSNLDWRTVAVINQVANDTIPMRWYGEYLWSTTLPTGQGVQGLKILAVDRNGNATEAFVK